jgi:hypothetical protein
MPELLSWDLEERPQFDLAVKRKISKKKKKIA